MVKRILFAVFLLTFAAFTNSCFLIYEAFVYDSDVDERRQEMNNTHFVDSLPPLDTGSGSYSFILLTDSHIAEGKTDGLERLNNIIADHGNIKFAVILGDITDGREIDYKVYVELAGDIAQEHNIPFYPVLGNHDLIGDGWKNWKNYIGSTNYRRDNQNTTLIFLDSGNIYYGKDQLNWLESELRTVRRNVFIFSHAPLFAPGYLLQVDSRERARMASILRNKCDIMFTGHTHVRYAHRTGNVNYITVESYRDDKAYCIATVTDSGNITYEFKKF